MLLLVRVSLVGTGMKIQQEGFVVGMLPRSGGQPKKGKLVPGTYMLDLPCPK